MECIHDLFYANHHQVVQVQKTQSEWQAWKKVLSAALFIELFIDLLPSQRTCTQTSYSEVNGNAKIQ